MPTPYSPAYYAANKARFAERQAAWNAANPDKVRRMRIRWETANPDKVRAKTRRWRAANLEQYKATLRKSRLKKDYGITPEQYDELFRAQNGVCLICLHPPKTRRLNVDHCHRTLRIRGLLCHRCNYGFGYFRSREDLERAVIYWDRDTGLVVPKKRKKKKRKRATGNADLIGELNKNETIES